LLIDEDKMNLVVPNSVITALPDVIKGNADWRTYRAFRLENGVTCVVVHDKESKTTACSVCVGSGASADPRELSGLAHFAEHMCFLGSKAYPVENEFKKYLSAHGGRSNASTAMSQTTYKFDVLSEHAEKAIDIFSNFFISPLFTRSGTAREVNAVDSENSKNMSNDGRRRLQILKAMADEQHHYSKFSTGNAQTLVMATPTPTETHDDTSKSEKEKMKVDDDESKDEFVREALLAYHRLHYRPDNMSVVLVGPQDLDTLQEWIVPRYGSITNRWEDKSHDEMTKAEQAVVNAARDAPIDSFGSPSVPFYSPFQSNIQDNSWPLVLTTLPLQSARKLFIYFPLPSVTEFKDKSPFHIICHLLGHEGPGSCFAALQDAELINGLSAGSRLSEVDHSLLQIAISLTEKGEEQWEDVVSTIFDYCQLIHTTVKRAKEQSDLGDDTGDELQEMERIWEEIQKLKSLRFHQTSPGQALSLAPNLAGSVRKNGSEKCMSIGSLLDETKDTLPLKHVLDFVSMMTPQNCFIEQCSQSAWQKRTKSLKDDESNSSLYGLKKEKWYGVDYHLSSIPNDVKQRWDWKTNKVNEGLHFPKENRYIPDDLSLSTDLPEEARKGPRIEKEREPPVLVVDDKKFGRLWHRLDDRYCLPKASLRLLIRNAAVQHKLDPSSGSWDFDATSDLYSGLIFDTFADALAQKTYDAELAGLHWSLTKTSCGILLSCSGYSQYLTKFAMDVLEQFYCDQSPDTSILNEKHIRTSKDKMTRHFESYLKSKRADTYASYYTSLLMSSRSLGVEHSLSLSENISAESLREHHRRLISLPSAKVECLVSGNVSQGAAEIFFANVSRIMNKAKALHDRSMDDFDYQNDHWIPGPFQRNLEDCEDTHLHFQSKNPEEQNGAVRMTFQSASPGFKGTDMDCPLTHESLTQTAALRVMCHMLREPLFNQLRTKEQLGYIVNSFYDIDFFMESNPLQLQTYTTPINKVIVNVLSRKVSPPVLTQRIDEFLNSFRGKLSDISEDEIRNHTDSLSRKLLKPVQKLETEVDMNFNKIRRYSPELLDNYQDLDDECAEIKGKLPWQTNKSLAAAIQKVTREDIVHAWDSVIGQRRSRVVSHIYGSSFPLNIDSIPSNTGSRHGLKSRKKNGVRNIVQIESMENLIENRLRLVPFGNGKADMSLTTTSTQLCMKRLSQNKVVMAGFIAGASLLLYTLNTISSRKQGERKDRPKG